MTDLYNKKVEDLRRRFRELESAVVAFSGGVDSSVLVVIGHEELGSKMIAVTAVSASLPERDRKLAKSFCEERGIAHSFTESREFDDQEFLGNPDNRCYFCKKYLYSGLTQFADKIGAKFIVEGTNASDLTGHRPGYRASCENDRVVTPLIDVQFTKEEVRRLASDLHLSTAEKPASACLSSRVPTGVTLDSELLRRIDSAEELIRGLGVSQVRVRHNGDVARIEVAQSDLLLCVKLREEICENIKKLGWKFVTLDLDGYRTGGAKG